ncbi:nucleoside hydrolase [Psychrilyobacter atlanticus]|uniref:nucleoside hydrolase n=1 Tax=Psychrilyobacter atlanticus TaxID=271091 RepID=UPI000410092A|nr:nucleoside hydrolase [Psychrilyobacter atlanticus]
MQKIILDCDPGMDDALAIIIGLADKNIDMLGITTVAGNVELSHTTRNALNLLEYLNEEIDVYRGLKKPLTRDLHTATEFHGETGMGDIELPNSSKEGFEGYSEFYLKCAKKYPQELELVAVGPLTNVANALIKYPELKKLLKGITIMGGSLCGGNITPHAEFNIYVDPEAANIVFNSGLEVKMIGLDATMKGQFAADELEEIRKSDSKYSKVTMEIFDSMFRVREKIGMTSVVFHDTIALIAPIYNNAFKFEEKNILVGIEEKRGETAENFKGGKIKVAVDFNKDWFKKYLIETLK